MLHCYIDKLLHCHIATLIHCCLTHLYRLTSVERATYVNIYSFNVGKNIISINCLIKPIGGRLRYITNKSHKILKTVILWLHIIDYSTLMVAKNVKTTVMNSNWMRPFHLHPCPRLEVIVDVDIQAWWYWGVFEENVSRSLIWTWDNGDKQTHVV